MLPNVQAARHVVCSACSEVRGTQLCLLDKTDAGVSNIGEASQDLRRVASLSAALFWCQAHTQGYLTPPSSSEETGEQTCPCLLKTYALVLNTSSSERAKLVRVKGSLAVSEMSGRVGYCCSTRRNAA